LFDSKKMMNKHFDMFLFAKFIPNWLFLEIMRNLYATRYLALILLESQGLRSVALGIQLTPLLR